MCVFQLRVLFRHYMQLTTSAHINIKYQWLKFHGLLSLFLLCRKLHFGNTYNIFTVLLLLNIMKVVTEGQNVPFHFRLTCVPSVLFHLSPWSSSTAWFPPSVSSALACSQCLSSLVKFVFKPVLFPHSSLVRLSPLLDSTLAYLWLCPGCLLGLFSFSLADFSFVACVLTAFPVLDFSLPAF